MSEKPRHALWVTPDDRTSPALVRLIERFSKRYHGPLFEPHITLFSGIDEEAMARRLARECQIDLSLQKISRGSFLLDRLDGLVGDRLRALYLRVPRLSWLLLAEARVRTRLNVRGGEYMPHLSLFYGKLSLKQRRAAQLEAEAAWPLSFRVGAIEVWRTEAEVEVWHKLCSLPLKDM